METAIAFARAEVDPVTLEEALRAGQKAAPDAIGMLLQDHREAQQLFIAYSMKADDRATRALIIKRLSLALRAHMAIEEELIYPLAEQLTGDKQMVERARNEHHEAKELIDRLGAATPTECDRIMLELEKAILAHVDEEETRFFPELLEAGLDRYETGARLAALRLDVYSRLTEKPVPAHT